jgi:hypothetical protein
MMGHPAYRYNRNYNQRVLFETRFHLLPRSENTLYNSKYVLICQDIVEPCSTTTALRCHKCIRAYNSCD